VAFLMALRGLDVRRLRPTPSQTRMFLLPLVIGCDEQGQIPTRLVDQYELAETGLTYDPSPVVLGSLAQIG
jgi:hypothetical protein